MSETRKKNLLARWSRVYFRTLKHILKRIKPLLSFILKVILWLILFGAILFFTNYTEEKIPFYIVFCAYIFLVTNYYSLKNNYKIWQESESEFYKRFCEKWHPTILGYLFVFAFGIMYFDLFQFILFMFIAYCMELWDRRFITNEIKQDLILEKLKN